MREGLRPWAPAAICTSTPRGVIGRRLKGRSIAACCRGAMPCLGRTGLRPVRSLASTPANLHYLLCSHPHTRESRADAHRNTRFRHIVVLPGLPGCHGPRAVAAARPASTRWSIPRFPAMQKDRQVQLLSPTRRHARPASVSGPRIRPMRLRSARCDRLTASRAKQSFLTRYDAGTPRNRGGPDNALRTCRGPAAARCA